MSDNTPVTTDELHAWLGRNGVGLVPCFREDGMVARYACANVDLDQLLAGLRSLMPAQDGFSARLRARVETLVWETFQDAAAEVTRAVTPPANPLRGEPVSPLASQADVN